MKCYNHLRKEASYTFSSVGGTIITKIPQGELLKAFYKFAKSKDGGKGKPSSNKNTNVDNFDAKQLQISKKVIMVK